jgi:CDP-6-deoxy-D-xylo-4-hexulose-3-dehydrase
VAAGFPTTVNPILQFGAVPVFVDVDLATHNIDAADRSRHRPQDQGHHAGPFAGQPLQPGRGHRLCKKHGLWLVEDCCDALGATYRASMVGTFGDIATLSFYPAHHITMGEGGAVFTNNDELKPSPRSFATGAATAIARRARTTPAANASGCQQLGDLPFGYDHKYTYSHLGYNLKITDMQAACGWRRWTGLTVHRRPPRQLCLPEGTRLQSCAEFLHLPEATPGSEPSWFGFAVTSSPKPVCSAWIC